MYARARVCVCVCVRQQRYQFSVWVKRRRFFEELVKMCISTSIVRVDGAVRCPKQVFLKLSLLVGLPLLILIYFCDPTHTSQKLLLTKKKKKKLYFLIADPYIRF
jgi:hypothetical protein